MAGKTSKPRPFSVDRDTYATNWDRTFGGGSSEEESQEEWCRKCGAEACRGAVIDEHGMCTTCNEENR